MTANRNYESVPGVARGVLSASIIVTLLLAGGISRAQSNTSSASSPGGQVSPRLAQTTAPVPNMTQPIQVPTNAKELLAATPHAKTAGEGIAVHGRWIIDVRNPDGTLVSHQDFENAVDPIEGADVLTGVLSGEYTPVGFFVALYAPNGILCNGNVFGSPSGICVLYDTRNPNFCSPAAVSSNACSNNLTYTPNSGTVNNNAIGYTLSGSITLPNLVGGTNNPAGGTITTVGHGITSCEPGFDVPGLLSGSQITATIPEVFGNGTQVSNAAVSTAFSPTAPSAGSVAGQGGFICGQGFPANNLLTSRTISQPVLAGQSVAVTVVITFGSSN
jgi:hypothetical protein